MAELSTIARPYAEALFAAATSDKPAAAGALDQWLSLVAELRPWPGTPRCRRSSTIRSSAARRSTTWSAADQLAAAGRG